SDLEVEMKPVKGKLYHIAYPVGRAVTSRVEGLAEAYAAANDESAPRPVESAAGESVPRPVGSGNGESVPRPVGSGNGLLKTSAGDFVVVATTRPETMLGDTAIAFNPEDERYRALAGKSATLPLVGRELLFIQDEIVEKDFGTGFVKVTPAHDPNDFAMGRRHNLEFIQVIDKDARVTDAAPEKYRGLDRYEARKQIIADLESLGLMLKVEDYTHNVGHCQRSGVAIEPLVSTQWFMRMKPLAEPAIAAVREGRTKFAPESAAKIYFNWLENIQDWCISRQLWWGHRIPAWYTPDGQPIVGRDEQEARQRLAERGVDPNIVLREEEDVLDTWFSS
ncbi:MAG: class I tRNA ligase family protein, partial [Blastocatellia bacterium]